MDTSPLSFRILCVTKKEEEDEEKEENRTKDLFSCVVGGGVKDNLLR